MLGVTAPAVERLPTARNWRHVRAVLRGWTAVIVVAALWQLVSALLRSPVFPSFTRAVSATVGVLGSATLMTDIVPSVERTLGGFAIASVLGVAIGLPLGYFRRVGDTFSAVIDFLRAMPMPMLIPLAIVFFGIGAEMVIVLIVVTAVWPVLLNAFDGARRLEPVYVDTARVYGVRGPAVLWRVLLPGTAPFTIAGLRTALSLALQIMVVAEMLGARSGIGYFIQVTQQSFLIPQTYAGVIVLGIMGWAFDTAFLFAEHRLLGWEEHMTGHADV